jgi:hypothetical protein
MLNARAVACLKQPTAGATNLARILYIRWVRRLQPQFGSRHVRGIFVSSTASKPVPGPTQPPIQWATAAVSKRISGRGVKLTIHVHLVPKLF